MRKLGVFNNISLDGYFCDAKGSMNWAHQGDDAEMKEFAGSNAEGGGGLVFGRITYEEMKAHWPTPEGQADQATVSDQMTKMPKYVFSRTLKGSDWDNTKILSGDPAEVIRDLKAEDGPDLTILGSGSIVTPLAAAGLIDSYALIVHPVVIGGGRTMFEGIPENVGLTLQTSRQFKSGKMFLAYELA